MIVKLGRVPHSHVEVDGVEERLLLQLWQHGDEDAVRRRGQAEGDDARVVAIDLERHALGQGSHGVEVVVRRQGDLLEVIEALGAPRGLARRLHGR